MFTHFFMAISDDLSLYKSQMLKKQKNFIFIAIFYPLTLEKMRYRPILKSLKGEEEI